MRKTQSTKTERPLGKIELIAIALGGMIGGGIFSILGVSVEIIGTYTPIAIFLGGLLAGCAAYAYSKLAAYYEDEGATYSFFKKTFPQQKFAIASIGWLIVFGYISTLALYAFTFSSYFSTLLPQNTFFSKEIIAFIIIFIFGSINIISVNGMGKVEDLMVYIKIAILIVISTLFLKQSNLGLQPFYKNFTHSLSPIITVAAITFVAYEGFQLTIHAYEEAESPKKNIPSAIYWSIGITTFIYVILAMGALSIIPKEILIRDKEFALAAGATEILGNTGHGLIILGALLATSSAINGTLFGASRLIAVIAEDGVFPYFLSKRVHGHIPKNAIIFMGAVSYLFVLTGGLQVIIEFGSITFIIVSLLMAYSNFYIRKKTKSHPLIAMISILLLTIAAGLIIFHKFKTNYQELIYIVIVYVALIGFAKFYSTKTNLKFNT
ncbi:MAG: amino acid permease [Bdellovibrionaceae bacterium]|nr:amino acid permease [Pseudobdellovibrionaceae bacterium]|tara:strand:- start:1183 stop:2493 length:1311 start_codon:yes stop_codon:yes gene_type:complete